MITAELPVDPVTGRPVVHGLPVPFITRWTGEIDTARRPLHFANASDGRLAIAIDDPRLNPFGLAAGFNSQRDEFGLLWHRDLDRPGSGEPEFKSVHAARQRQCMIDGRCQVCGKRFGADPVTFLDSVTLLNKTTSTQQQAQGRPFQTFTAPTCAACVPTVLAKCPANRGTGRVLVTAHAYRPCAVSGDLYGAGYQEQARIQIDIDDPRISRFVVKQIGVEVLDYTEERVS